MSELTNLHDAILSTIKAAMPHVQTVDEFPASLDSPFAPTIYCAISAMDLGTDPGDGRSGIRATVEARVLVDASLPQAPLQAATLAAQLINLLRCQYWNLDFVDAAKAVRALPVSSAAEPLQSAVWTVQWQQVIYLGQEEWLWPDQPPGTLMLSISPDASPGHEAGYQSPEQME